MNPTLATRLTTALVTLFLLAAAAVTPALAQESDQPAWAARINVAKMWDSPAMNLIRERAMAEHPDVQQKLDALSEALGIDPRMDIGEVVMYGSDYEGDATLIAQLGETTGNLEGWALTAPGYESDELEGGLILHSFLVPDDRGHRGPGGAEKHEHDDDRRGGWGDARFDHPRMNREGRRGDTEHRGPRDGGPMMRGGREMRRVYVTLPKMGDRFLAVASFDRDTAVSLSKGDAAKRKLGEPPADDVVMSLRVNEMPHDAAMGPRPGSALLRSLERVEMSVASGERFKIDIALTADEPLRAQQMMQLLGGLQAMVAMAGHGGPREKLGADLVSAMKLSREDDSNTVNVKLDWSQADLEAFVERAAELERRGPRPGGFGGERR